MKPMTRNRLLWSGVSLGIAACVSMLLRLWTSWPPDEFLWKFVVTCGILIVIIGAVLLVSQNIDEEGEQKKDRFLN